MLFLSIWSAFVNSRDPFTIDIVPRTSHLDYLAVSGTVGWTKILKFQERLIFIIQRFSRCELEQDFEITRLFR